VGIKLAKIVEEYQFVSDKISTQIRTVALGIIAFIWIILIGKDPLPLPLPSSYKGQFFIIGFLCLLILFFDFLQYFFSYLLTSSLIDKTEADKKIEAVYNYKDLRYRLCNVFFIVKIVTLFIAVLWVSILVITYIISFI
jgi:hypothetical protein